MKSLRRCVVMEIKGNFVYLLAEGGAFFRIYWRGSLPKVGDEVYVCLPSRFVSLTLWGRGALVACLAIFLFIVSAALSYHYAPHAAAYVSLDINPSVELLLNTRDRVMEARALNEEGEKLIRDVYLLGIPSERAIQIIVNRAAQFGYMRLDRYNLLLISITPVKGEKRRPELKEKLLKEAKKALDSEHVQGVVKGLETSPELRERALKLGLSPGRYAILVESLCTGLNVSPEDLKEKSISDVLQEAGGSISKILNSMAEGILEGKEKRALEKKRLQQQDAQKGSTGLTGLLNEILNPVVSGLTQTLQPSAASEVPEKSILPQNEGLQEKTLDAVGGESQPFLEKALEPLKENILEPISKNVLTPLDNLLSS